MTNSKKKQETKAQAIAELESRGAVLEKTEDRYGVTRSGWWLEGVWLAPTSKPLEAIRCING